MSGGGEGVWQSSLLQTKPTRLFAERNSVLKVSGGAFLLFYLKNWTCKKQVQRKSFRNILRTKESNIRTLRETLLTETIHVCDVHITTSIKLYTHIYVVCVCVCVCVVLPYSHSTHELCIKNNVFYKKIHDVICATVYNEYK